ncbi:MAG: P-II family nitrogen regulator [Vicinamibacterales bacterium]
MYEVKSIIRPERVASVIQALHEIPNVPGITVSVVRGYGKRTPATSDDAPQYGETEMAKLETVVPEELLQQILGTVQEVAGTGRPGDGKVFVIRVEEAVEIHSGDRGSNVL